ncbi:hypothetical protein TSAR_009524, partial [Trichomalopsis sarcophagae]
LEKSLERENSEADEKEYVGFLGDCRKGRDAGISCTGRLTPSELLPDRSDVFLEPYLQQSQHQAPQQQQQQSNPAGNSPSSPPPDPRHHHQLHHVQTINKNSINIYGNKSSFATRGFLVAEHEYRDGNTLLGSWCPGWAVSTSSPTVSRKINNFFVPKLVTREFLRSQNTNIVTLTLLEVPSAQEDDVDTVYPGHQIPRKRLSSLYSYTVTSKTPNQRVSTKYVVILRETPGDDETTLIQPTLGAGYLEERCRRYIRVQRPPKSSINESREKMSLIFHETPGDDVDTDNPGHQVLLRVLPSLYSCSSTSKTPE